jgi:hypothetical protein
MGPKERETTFTLLLFPENSRITEKMFFLAICCLWWLINEDCSLSISLHWLELGSFTPIFLQSHELLARLLLAYITKPVAEQTRSAPKMETVCVLWSHVHPKLRGTTTGQKLHAGVGCINVSSLSQVTKRMPNIYIWKESKILLSCKAIICYS